MISNNKYVQEMLFKISEKIYFCSKTFYKILPEYCKSAEMGKSIVSKMKEALKQAQKDKQIGVSETILYTTGEIARYV